MSAKRICIKKKQQTLDVGDKDKKVVINSLDYDSLAKIIMWLPIPERIDMEEVCTKWKEASQLAWYDIKKYKCESSIGRCYDNRLLTQSYLEEILLRCGNYLKELSLSDVCDSSIMPFVSDHCKNLTTLECKFDYNFLIDNADHFVQAFTQLDKLACIKITVGHNSYLENTINLSAISNSLPEEIKEIHLFSKPRYNRKLHIFMSLQRFRNLQKLTSVGLCLDNINLQEIADITTLVHLDIRLYNIHTNLFLFNKLVNLEYIDLTMGIECDVTNFSTKVLETIFCTCKNLKHLNIPAASYNIAEIPRKKWINFRNLEYLSICCDIMPDLANTIVEYCKNLKHLKHNPRYTAINNTALKKLTELKNLESLILTKTNELHEESITAISNNCKKLKRLEIPDSTIKPAIDDEPLSFPSVLDDLSKLQYLEHLNLRSTENLEDSTIIAIANNCKNLKSLNIENCRSLTETALDALTNLKNLQKLNVGCLNIITDSFLMKLKGIKELYCDDCQKLTDAGIIQFIENNPDLERINIWILNNITINMIIGADQATKNRTNGIILHIMDCNLLLSEASMSIITSQWLVVEETTYSCF
ncbi:putative adenylate cyclase regulatory protein isoform X3 [Aphidius gifuensis]|uniref:putative adenylate cyclase regulatory protein isoform X3 n=1 Tax=Aphidius gifuensis TaxID=684658 RepID=UPI001CDD3DF3|nr:putative adenylate cyclase regulatory protein isoform X3 [Aphidius gifuensis]